MAIIFEDSEKVTRKKSPIPLKDREYYGALYNALEKIVPKNNLKNLKSLASTKHYNKKGNNKLNGKDQNVNYVSVEVAKKRMQRMNPNDIKQGGQKAYNFYKKTLERARNQEKVSPVAPPKPTNADVKPTKIEKETIKTPSGKITYMTSENKIIRESYDYNKFYEYLEEYDARYVFDSFLENPKGKQNWGVLINPNMYAKALREFTRYGNLATFPEKYVYQWMGIIMRNTAILYANTDIAGHSNSFPYDEFEDFLKSYFGGEREAKFDYDCDSAVIEITSDEAFKICNGDNFFINEAVDKYGQTYFPWINQHDADRIAQQNDYNRIKSQYGELYALIDEFNYDNQAFGRKIEIKDDAKIYYYVNLWTFLDDIGFYDWMQMPDGSDAFSDFGISPLFKIFQEYDENASPERVLVLVNKALDVYHQRGDMSSIFITGGRSSLNRISESVKRNKKKIYITENQIIRLKNGRNIFKHIH